MYRSILEEELEDTKGVIRIRKSKKGRQHNGQKIKTKGVIRKSVNRRTDNTVAKRKRTKGQTMMYKTYT